MIKYFSIGWALLLCQLSHAQHKFTISVVDAITLYPLENVNIYLGSDTSFVSTDSFGNASIQIKNEHDGLLHFSKSGYLSQTDTLNQTKVIDTFKVLLEPKTEEEEVLIRSTRSNRTIANTATRVEFIDGDELAEKANMRPGDIRMLLNESTGIQTQQVSATSASSSIRIQGLDGRYTQILKDGFPLFAGFSGGLGLLQTPPLDLQQVEIIKGASSTLYGGGAIAGLVNLISKLPTDEKELRFLLNGTSALGLDVSAYYGQRFQKTGWTILFTQNASKAYVPGNTIFTAIPKTERIVFNPRVFFYLSNKTTLSIGINTIFENRLGGYADYVEKKVELGYYEKNQSTRFGTQLSLEHKISKSQSWVIKNAINAFDRKITIPDYQFNGRQWATYTEINYNVSHNNASTVIGANLYTDQFKEKDIIVNFPLRNYNQITFGGFVQHEHSLGQNWDIEAGLRGDYSVHYGFSLLPKISILWKASRDLTSRLGGGLGYKAPNIFLDDAERIQFRNVLPINPDSNRLERSYGLNWDFNYKIRLFNTFRVNLNQLFFYTQINHPLLLQSINNELLRPTNIGGNLHTSGWETNFKLSWENFTLYVGYTYTVAKIRINGITKTNPLTARSRLNNVLMYEVENKWKIGVEAYYFSRQLLNDNTWGRKFWTLGFMVERKFNKISIFINFENFTDTRQTKYGSIYDGSIEKPVFKDIYAPLDGRVINGGVKYSL